MPNSLPFVERFQLSVLPGTDIAASTAALIREFTSPWPDGLRSGYWGTTVENPNRVEFWLIWENPASHIAFTTPEKVRNITNILIPIAATMPVVYHVSFKRDTHVKISTGITEILTFSPPPLEIEFKRGVHAQKGYLGSVQGKVGETVDGRRLYVAIVEWDDSDRKGKDRRASGFRMVGLDCRDISCVQIVRCHVKFRTF